ncbi:hypothetical protein K523DRAFT_347578 [Schizophyllum commune Tattone D]|nr:hypothetical protein K525DRAFT_262689 [Schizophyllum commune Loenen D]KAI5834976.1 hypothetical protein K523DRAFT_347578 [Schizophyllum commune Tattone D]
MASGYAAEGGGRGRCYPYWQEFLKCYTRTDLPTKCRPASDDYFECLHRTKEIARQETVRNQMVLNAKAEAADALKAHSKSSSAGLISPDASEDSK